MKRRIMVLLTVLCLLPACLFCVHAENSRLDDSAALLTEAEALELENLLNEISLRQGLDIVIVTVDSVEDQTLKDYADHYYDYGGYAPDGILLLVSMGESDCRISTAGYGITAFTDAGLEYMFDQFISVLSDGEYAKAFQTFAQLCDEFITQAKTGDPYDSHNLPKEPFSVLGSLVIAVVIGLIAAWIVTGNMKNQLNTAVKKVKADNYITGNSLQLTGSRDLFLYTKVERKEKPKSSGSTTHTSSSGTTHGGSGRSF